MMAVEVGAPVRVRLDFEDHKYLLKKSLREHGVRRCWVLLRPELATIRDLAAHVARRYGLPPSCPGLLFSMDDCLLHPSESTSIFRDKDIIRVREELPKKIERNDDADDIWEHQQVQSQHLPANGEVLAIEYHEESKQIACQHEENFAVNEGPVNKNQFKKKRKHVDNPEGSKNSQNELDCQTKVIEPRSEHATPKLPSRSARRKKAKRQFLQAAKCQFWLEKLAKRQLRENLQEQELPNGIQCPFSSHEPAEQDSETSGEQDSETSGGESSKLQPNETQVSLNWNGPVSKKKGQMWGMKNLNKRNGDNSHYGQANRRDNFDCNANDNIRSNENNCHEAATKRSNENAHGRTDNRKNTDNSYDESASDKFVVEEKKYSNVNLDFESLFPLTRIPKEGDLIVYRVAQLSSSGCPELSPFRIGEVLIYDPISTRIILLPVADYRNFPKEKKAKDESDLQPNLSLYKEDGSLEIEYSFLVDVRLLKDGESRAEIAESVSKEPAKNGGVLNRKVNNWGVAVAESSAKDSDASRPEDTQSNGAA